MTTPISISKKTFKTNMFVSSTHFSSSTISTAATAVVDPTLTLHATPRSLPLVHAARLVHRLHLRRLQQIRRAQPLHVLHVLHALRPRERKQRPFHAERVIPAVTPREKPSGLCNEPISKHSPVIRSIIPRPQSTSCPFSKWRFLSFPAVNTTSW